MCVLFFGAKKRTKRKQRTEITSRDLRPRALILERWAGVGEDVYDNISGYRYSWWEVCAAF